MADLVVIALVVLVTAAVTVVLTKWRLAPDADAVALAAITEGNTRVVIAAATLTSQKVITNGIHRRNVSTVQAAEQVFLQTAAWNDGDPFLLSQASINAIVPA